MVRFLARTVIILVANALGLLITSLILANFHIQLVGFVVSVGVFTLCNILLEPFVLKLAIKYMPALRGGIALVTTFISLLITTIFTNALQISGLNTWVLASLIVWLVVVIAGILLPLVMFKQALSARQNNSKA